MPLLLIWKEIFATSNHCCMWTEWHVRFIFWFASSHCHQSSEDFKLYFSASSYSLEFLLLNFGITILCWLFMHSKVNFIWIIWSNLVTRFCFFGYYSIAMPAKLCDFLARASRNKTKLKHSHKSIQSPWRWTETFSCGNWSWPLHIRIMLSSTGKAVYTIRKYTNNSMPKGRVTFSAALWRTVQCVQYL